MDECVMRFSGCLLSEGTRYYMVKYRRLRRRRRPRVEATGLTKSERYVCKVLEGCGSRRLKEYLMSTRPLDKFLNKTKEYIQ